MEICASHVLRLPGSYVGATELEGIESKMNVGKRENETPRRPLSLYTRDSVAILRLGHGCPWVGFLVHRQDDPEDWLAE
jgi:hypothetical protein